MVTPVVEREARVHLVERHELSQRRACKVIGCCRMTVRYASVRPDDAVLRGRMKAVSQKRRKFSYRRIHVLLVLITWCIHYNIPRLTFALGYRLPALVTIALPPALDGTANMQ